MAMVAMVAMVAMTARMIQTVQKALPIRLDSYILLDSSNPAQLWVKVDAAFGTESDGAPTRRSSVPTHCN